VSLSVHDLWCLAWGDTDLVVRRGNGGTRGYSWPPFTPESGAEAATVHGATSERRVGPLADEIAAALLGDPDCPPHLHRSVFRPALLSWARSEAAVLLVVRWLDTLDVVGALSEVTDTTEESEQLGARGSRHTSARRIASGLDILDRYERRAQAARGRLGLDPVSALALRSFGEQKRVDVMTLMAERIAELEAEGGEG
jgi:hypothetical protein